MTVSVTKHIAIAPRTPIKDRGSVIVNPIDTNNHNHRKVPQGNCSKQKETNTILTNGNVLLSFKVTLNTFLRLTHRK